MENQLIHYDNETRVLIDRIPTTEEIKQEPHDELKKLLMGFVAFILKRKTYSKYEADVSTSVAYEFLNILSKKGYHLKNGFLCRASSTNKFSVSHVCITKYHGKKPRSFRFSPPSPSFEE